MQGPQDDRDGENDAARVFYKGPSAIAYVSENVGPLRRMKWRKLHHEVVGMLIGSEFFAEDFCHGKSSENSDKVDGSHDEPLLHGVSFLAVQQHGYQEKVNREPCGAGHPWGNEDGHEAFFGGIDGACGHDRWNRAGVGAEQGEKGFP